MEKEIMCGPGMEMLMLIHDDCVLCGKETEYTADMTIDERSCYVEGSGQLCNECYDKIYKKRIINDTRIFEMDT